METGLETKVAFGDMMQAFEAFKDANDERLGEIEKRMSADVVTAEKVDRINRAVDEAKARLDELTLKGRRPQLSGETGEAPALREVTPGHVAACHLHDGGMKFPLGPGT